jgi:hypothetical protein
MFLFVSVSTMLDQVTLFLTSSFDGGFLLAVGGGIALAFAIGAATAGGVPEDILAAVRRWHGGIDDQFNAINNLVNVVLDHQSGWNMPGDMLEQLTENRETLNTLIGKCQSTSASSVDRMHRNTLLKDTISLCLLHVKLWAYGKHEAGLMTTDDIHQLGFLLPGENGGRHSRTKGTDILTEVKVRVLTLDLIRVVIDQSANENAGPVLRGWPKGVKHALIVVLAPDGVTEIYHQLTSHLHTDIKIPASERGKTLIVKAAFLKHVDDVPCFGNEPMVTMPISTEDLAAALAHQE